MLPFPHALERVTTIAGGQSSGLWNSETQFCRDQLRAADVQNEKCSHFAVQIFSEAREYEMSVAAVYDDLAEVVSSSQIYEYSAPDY